MSNIKSTMIRQEECVTHDKKHLMYWRETSLTKNEVIEQIKVNNQKLTHVKFMSKCLI